MTGMPLGRPDPPSFGCHDTSGGSATGRQGRQKRAVVCRHNYAQDRLCDQAGAVCAREEFPVASQSGPEPHAGIFAWPDGLPSASSAAPSTPAESPSSFCSIGGASP